MIILKAMKRWELPLQLTVQTQRQYSETIASTADSYHTLAFQQIGHQSFKFNIPHERDP